MPAGKKLPPLGRIGEDLRRRVSSLKPIDERKETAPEDVQDLRARLRSM